MKKNNENNEKIKNLSVGSGIAVGAVAVAGVIALGLALHGTKPKQRVEVLLAFATVVAEIRGS